MKTLFLIFITLFTYSLNAQTGYYPYKHENKWGIINSKKEIILEPKYQYKIMPFYNNYKKNPVAKFEDKRNEKFGTGLISFDGKEIIPPVYKQIYPTKDNSNILFLETHDDSLSLYNIEMERIILKNIYKEKTGYDTKFKGDTIIIYDFDSERSKMFSITGEFLLEASKDNTLVVNEDDMLFFESSPVDDNDLSEEDYRDMIKKKDSLIYIVETASYSSYFYAIAKKGEKVGLLNEKGNILLDYKYDRLRSIDEDNNHLILLIDKIKGEMNIKFGLYNLMLNKVIIEPKYEYIGLAEGQFPYFDKKKGRIPFAIHNYVYVMINKNTAGYANIKTGEVYLPILK